jgi:hypothetical protein
VRLAWWLGVMDVLAACIVDVVTFERIEDGEGG